MNMTSAVSVSETGDLSYCDVARPLDLVHLAKYTFGDRGLECELLGLFRSQAGIYVSRLETAANAKEWRDAAHSLKGSARGSVPGRLATLPRKLSLWISTMKPVVARPSRV